MTFDCILVVHPIDRRTMLRDSYSSDVFSSTKTDIKLILLTGKWKNNTCYVCFVEYYIVGEINICIGNVVESY
jgi:hypothetical protein